MKNPFDFNAFAVVLSLVLLDLATLHPTAEPGSEAPAPPAAYQAPATRPAPPADTTARLAASRPRHQAAALGRPR